MSQRCHTVVESPVGPITVVASGGALCGLFMDAQRHRPPDADFGRADGAPFASVIEQLGQYFAGQRTSFDLELAPIGSPFRLAVWEALRSIPYGRTASYGEVAGLIGKPGAARAVGLANGANPIAIVVPCHRVIGANGSLTGYGGGLERKRWLLDLEQRATASVRSVDEFKVAAPPQL